MISRSQMNRQLYQIGGLSSLYNNSGGQKPIYPRISDIESSLYNAEQKIGDPSLGSSSGTSDGGFGSPMGGVYSGSMGGELPNEQPGLPPIQQAVQQGPLQIPSTLINPVRDGVDTSQLGSPRTGGMGSAIDFGQLSSLFGGVGDPRLGAPDVPNSLQQQMRGGAANGGLMNRQLYANGTGIAELLKMNQGAAQDELTEEQAFAMMPEGVKEAYNSMLQAGASPEEARRLISEQIAKMSRQSAMMSEQQMQGESQNIPEYYDPRLQILTPEQMREEMQNPSMPGYAYGGLIGRQQYGLGSLVKSVTKGITGAVKGAVGAVKDIASSDLGKAALAAAAMYYGGGGNLFGLQRAGMSGFSFGNLPGAGFLQGAKTGIGNLLLGTPGDMGGRVAGTSLLSKIGGTLGKIGTGTLLAGGLGLAAGSMLSPQQIQEGMKRNPEAVRSYLRQYYINTNPEATESEAESFASEQTREYAAQGGIMGVPLGELRTNQEGVKEIDYRQTGGFVPPIGIKEKADDVPAMLSNNEFVFTADAVRNAGGGDVNKGAQKMYTLMKTLENGGMA